MKKISLLLLACSLLGGWAQAQNAQFDPYRGGNGDGHTSDSLIVFQMGKILMYAPFGGGNGNGFDSDSLIAFQAGKILMYAPFGGGNGDGYAGDSLITFQMGYINMYSPYGSTGRGDGASTDSLISFPAGYITMFQPFGGGAGDGWSGYGAVGLNLPVNWLSFTGKQQNSTHLLEWQTQETNVSHYELERSPAGSRFVKLGTVSSKTNGRNTYNYTDGSPLTGENYYRVKQVDKDGKTSYSNTILLRLSKDGSISVYPNPAVKSLLVNMRGNDAGMPVQLSIYDMNGKQVFFQKITGNNQTVAIPVYNFAAGTYTMQLFEGGKLSVYKFIKL